MGSSPGGVHQRTHVIQTPQNTSPYIDCPIDKLMYDTKYGKFNRPSTVPDVELEPSCYLPTSCVPCGGRMQCSVEEIIDPLPNMSAWRLYHHFWTYTMQSRTSRKAMQDILQRPNFSLVDAATANFNKIDAILAAQQLWSNAAEGWRQASVTIGIPSGHRPNSTSRCSEYTA